VGLRRCGEIRKKICKLNRKVQLITEEGPLEPVNIEGAWWASIPAGSASSSLRWGTLSRTLSEPGWIRRSFRQSLRQRTEISGLGTSSKTRADIAMTGFLPPPGLRLKEALATLVFASYTFATRLFQTVGRFLLHIELAFPPRLEAAIELHYGVTSPGEANTGICGQVALLRIAVNYVCLVFAAAARGLPA
jgi:hypothetical protein